MVDNQETMDTGSDSGKKGNGKKSTAKKTEPKPKHLISFSEYRATTEREVTFVLMSGFKVWMKTDKKEPLRSRTFSDWENLIEEYLKS